MDQARRAAHTADTRQGLVTAARELFVAKGYAATPTEEIVARAGVTRGALYHHFRDKAALFRAVMNEVAGEVAAELVTRELARGAGRPGDAWQQLRQGLQTYLDVCIHSDFQRVVLIDGPTALGHEAWGELIERHGHSLLAQWLRKAVDEGQIPALPITALTRLIGSLISEASLYIALAAEPTAARQEVGAALDGILSGLHRTRRLEPPPTAADP